MPNPASDQVMLTAWTPIGTVRVWDLQGREVDSRRTDGAGRAGFDVSGWAEGVYLAGGWDATLAKGLVKFEVQR